MRTIRNVAPAILLFAFGCGAPKPDAGEATTPVDPTDDDDDDTTAGEPDPDDSTGNVDPSETTSPGETSEGGEESSDGGMPFIIPLDGGTGQIECDVWAQDCPEGEKCMPWANDGGNSWNATRCSPLDPNPAVVGDECQVEGTGVSGIDSCEVSSMCWNVDPETNLGTCVAFCDGSEANPICSDPNTTCNILNDGVLILCLPSCDPLLQDCNDGEACYPTGDAFSCIPDAGGEQGLFGEGCEFVNVCDPGLFCAVPDGVPDCQGSLGCCSSFCDLSDPDASAACPGAAGGQECVTWYEEGQAPPGYENVGACLIPA
jgi:hypothetical protein